jgi:hypothetical protein
VDTLRDVAYTAHTAGPYVGLRDGTFTIQGQTANCKGIVYVPGVSITGPFRVLSGSATVRVTTPSGAGTLSISKRSITGRISGHRVHARGATLTVFGGL